MQKGSKNISRREFINHTGAVAALSVLGFPSVGKPLESQMRKPSKITIKNVDSNFEREPLTPYRFKGSAITEAWQTVARLEGESGIGATGLGTPGNSLV